tara:strand:- start:222 stop:443 length:222 start_codon:yes stop_codon:yes gene_type:complete
MKMLYLLLLIFITLISFTSNSFAYLDPGTGSIILQAILGFVAASIATITLYWNKLKNFFKKLLSKKDKKPDDF